MTSTNQKMEEVNIQMPTLTHCMKPVFPQLAMYHPQPLKKEEEGNSGATNICSYNFAEMLVPKSTFSSACVCVSKCMCVCMHACVCVHLCMCLCACICVCMCMCVCVTFTSAKLKGQQDQP